LRKATQQTFLRLEEILNGRTPILAFVSKAADTPEIILPLHIATKYEK
jgi:hypothetical protein